MFSLLLILYSSLLVTGCSKGGSSSTEKSSSSGTIAIVNQDIGVESSGKTVNYSEEFIKTLDKKKYKVVSSASAEEGIKKGTYAGAIFFPSDLSANILNINYKNPQPINEVTRMKASSNDVIVRFFNFTLPILDFTILINTIA